MLIRSRRPRLLFLWFSALGCAIPLQGPTNAASRAQDHGALQQSAATPATVPTGIRLILKDGNYHLVRSYERNGERVRYFSAERNEWEELPANLVDWEATRQAEAENKAAAAALLDKVHKRELASSANPVMDVDASLLVGPSLFLPSGEGMFVVQGGRVIQLEQAGSEIKTDKKRLLEQIVSPVPLVPGKQNVLLPGKRAKVRIAAKSLEFYLREAPPDPERVTPIQRSSRPGESGPEVELVRATVKGARRQLESKQIFRGEESAAERKTYPIQRWEVAPRVYRFTLGAELPPGEYALAEILPDGINLYVWDFGVDAATAADARK